MLLWNGAVLVIESYAHVQGELSHRPLVLCIDSEKWQDAFLVVPWCGPHQDRLWYLISESIEHIAVELVVVIRPLFLNLNARFERVGTRHVGHRGALTRGPEPLA